MKTETIKLIGGYKDKDGVVHSEVTFGKRLNVEDLINIDTNPQAQNPTMYQDFIRRQMMTSFGTIKMPIWVDVLLSLDSIDREDLNLAADRFLALSREERTGEFRENHEVKLMFGFDIDGAIYDVVQFGNRITGKDEVEADAVGNGVARLCFLIGRQISRISTNDGLSSIEGRVDLKSFNSVDSEDLNLLRVGVEIARQSFRFKGENVSGKQNGADDSVSNEGNRTERKRSSSDAN